MNGQFEFKEDESGIAYHKEYPTVVAEYKEVVRSRLGDMKPVTVPSRLQDAYQYLISLENNSVVGRSGCDYGGSVPYGKTAIDQIVKSRRYDLIENILKGYNPGGRIYALLALLELQRNGSKLNDEIQNAIKVILDLKIGIDTCSGCLHRDKTAREIVSELNH